MAVVCALMIPSSAFAAGDVTLTTDTIIQVGSYTFNISGSSATIDSIVVGASNFQVTLVSGSSITISEPGLYLITNDVTSDVVDSMCSTATSSLSLSYTGAGSVTNTIGASATSCSTATPGAPSSVVATAGNAQASVSFTAPSQGGSAISSYAVVSSPGSITATGASSPITVSGLTNGTAYTFTVSATNQSGTGATSSPSSSITPVAPTVSSSDQGATTARSGGSKVPASALAFLLKGSAMSTANLKSSSTVPVQAATTRSYAFNKDLDFGSVSPDVKALQIWLNAHGYKVAASGAGSPGRETTVFGIATKAAIAKVQKAAGIKPASGRFGPATRAQVLKQQ